MKTIIAKTITGREFIYSAINCYSVAKNKASYYCKLLNSNNYHLIGNEIWHVYNVYDYDFENCNACLERLTIRNGKLMIIRN